MLSLVPVGILTKRIGDMIMFNYHMLFGKPETAWQNKRFDTIGSPWMLTVFKCAWYELIGDVATQFNFYIKSGAFANLLINDEGTLFINEPFVPPCSILVPRSCARLCTKEEVKNILRAIQFNFSFDQAILEKTELKLISTH